FLWRQRVDGAVAEQLTDSDGTDHQPDWSPGGGRIVFVRYDGRAMELMLLEVASGAVTALTSGGAVNVEPRWSPDGTHLAWVSTAGTGHFLLHTAWVRDGRLAEIRTIVADHRSAVRSEEHTSELQSRGHLVCRLLLEKKKKNIKRVHSYTPR